MMTVLGLLVDGLVTIVS